MRFQALSIKQIIESIQQLPASEQEKLKIKNIAKTFNLSYFESMNSLEFTTKIEHGIIHLPKEFEDYGNAIAHVKYW